jgi:hypothetical protein
MVTIRLSVRDAKGQQVRARVKHDKDGGNIVESPQASIEWQAQGNDVFRVVFSDLDKPQPAWIFPFEGDDDGAFGPDNAPSLKVKGAVETRTLRSDAPSNIKYEVYCTSESNAEPLDPMIIIREQAGISANLVLPVTFAVLGAIVGALATALLM